MKNIYITGISGTGKSSVIENLKNKGFLAIDTDYGDWKELSTDSTEWILKEDKIKKLLSKSVKNPVFLSGCCSNQINIYPFFHHIILLSASIETILKRVTNRTSNPYGKNLQEQNEIIWTYENVHPLLKRNSNFELNTETMSSDEITTFLIQLLRD